MAILANTVNYLSISAEYDAADWVDIWRNGH